MTSWLFLATCLLAAIVVTAVAVRGRQPGMLAAIGAAAGRSSFRRRWLPRPLIPPPRPLRQHDGVVWESIAMRYARHRRQCFNPEECPECRSLGHVLDGLVARRRPQPYPQQTLDRDVAELLDGHVPDEAGVCRGCVGGHAGRSCRDTA